MKKCILCFVIVFGVTTFAFCGPTSRIELNDGSVINAEIVSMGSGAYTLNTASMGKITLDAAKIKKIEVANTGSPTTENVSGLSNATVSAEIDKYKTSVMNNPEILKMATDLAADPQFQEILKDPEITSAITSGNFQALMSNPKFMSLVNHPKIQEIGTKLNTNTP